MKLLIVVVLCLAVPRRAATQLVEDRYAPEGKYPYQVALKLNGTFFCGGSIINNRWILTAAICVFDLEGLAANITVVAGTTLLYGNMEQSYKSDKFIAHPKFDPVTMQNDIAVIRVSKNIQFNDKVKPIGLTNRNPYPDDYPVVLTGWDSIFAQNSPKSRLREINLKIYNQQKCKQAYKNVLDFGNINDSQLCTVNRGGRGACHGDLGGPLVADGVQIGVEVYGRACEEGKPDVYTRVFSYIKWIAAATGSS